MPNRSKYSQPDCESARERIMELQEENKALYKNISMYRRNDAAPPPELTRQMIRNSLEAGSLSDEYFPKHTDGTEEAIMDGLIQSEEDYLNQVLAKMPDIPAAQLLYLIPILKEKLIFHINNPMDERGDMEFSSLMPQLIISSMEYMAVNGIDKEKVEESSKDFIEYDAITGYGEYIRKCLERMETGLHSPNDDDIFSICVDAMNSFNAFSKMTFLEIGVL